MRKGKLYIHAVPAKLLSRLYFFLNNAFAFVDIRKNVTSWEVIFVNKYCLIIGYSHTINVPGCLLARLSENDVLTGERLRILTILKRVTIGFSAF